MTDPNAPAGRSRGALDGLRVAVAQVRPQVADVASNLRAAERYLRRAAEKRASIVVFPECFLQGYSLRSEYLALAEPANGQSVSALCSLAATYGVGVVAGFIESNPADAHKPFNSAAVIDSAGRCVGVYRKTHLFRDEGNAFAAGDAYPAFAVELKPHHPAVRLGVAICMDIEYPEVTRLLALAGAQLIAVPSADMEPYRIQQMANLKSRAIENNLYVALANAVDEREDLTLFGGSGIAGPAGSFVSAGYRRPRLVVAELSDDEIEASGGAGSYLRGRRTETYTDLLRP